MCVCAYGHPGAAICDFQLLWFAFWSRVLCADLVNIIALWGLRRLIYVWLHSFSLMMQLNLLKRRKLL